MASLEGSKCNLTTNEMIERTVAERWQVALFQCLCHPYSGTQMVRRFMVKASLLGSTAREGRRDP